jgi:5'-nucleotidase
MKEKIILLTNDDGIDSEGIYKLYTVLKSDKRLDVKIIAPDRETSAVGHAITVFRPISVKKEYRDGVFFGYAVDGTPADCVKIAIGAILKETPDLIISGINRGANIGENIIYSGTVSAATEGTTLGISSMAVSVDNLINPDFSYAAKFTKEIVDRVIKNGSIPGGTLLNINIPDVPESEIKGVLVTRQSNARVKDKFIKRVDPMGRDYYWMDGEFNGENIDINTDYCAVKNNYISITPIHYDMTDYKNLDYFKKWIIKK